MFIDEKVLALKAGKGGNGAALFRREKYVPRGGPDGGDGGCGGDVIFTGTPNLHALSHLARTDRVEAEGGADGGHQRKTGKDGIDSVIKVPLGTQIRGAEAGELIIEITEEGQRYVAVRGGNGGWGNWHFKSSVRQTPDRANPGLAGGSLDVRLVLKLIADAGLIGLPNAGKSTLLSVISAARPKIADYPFTTLEPQLGVAALPDGCTVVVADLPGLIEGASGGKGLGTAFLKHIERTRTLVHCVSAGLEPGEMEAAYRTIRSELKGWSAELAAKPQLTVLTKADLLDADGRRDRIELLQRLSNGPVRAVSAAAHEGLRELLTALL